MLLGLLFMALLAAFDTWLVWHLLAKDIPSENISFLSFVVGLLVAVTIPVLAVVAYQTANCATLRYRLDRNGLFIRWGGSERILPIGRVERIMQGREVEGQIVNRRGLHWPGYERGEARLPGAGRISFFATRPVAEQLLVVTQGQILGISPRDPEGFVQAFEDRRALGPNRVLEPDLHRAGWLTWPLWTDGVARALLGTALAINLALFAYLTAHFPGLDIQLPLHFNAFGEADRIGPRIELFALPIIGLIILSTNLAMGLLLYKWERAGSYLLWGASIAAQVLFWLAALNLVP